MSILPNPRNTIHPDSRQSSRAIAQLSRHPITGSILMPSRVFPALALAAILVLPVQHISMSAGTGSVFAASHTSHTRIERLAIVHPASTPNPYPSCPGGGTPCP